MYVFGGREQGTNAVLTDVWSSADGTTWIQETTAVPWAARYDHDVLVLGSRMYVFGGREQGTNALLTDVWATPPP